MNPFSTIDPVVMREAELRMWLSELDALDENKRPDWRKRRIAATRVCELTGIADAIRAVSAGGDLDVPPPWPDVSIRPVGGGPGFLRVEVATTHADKGVMRVPLTIKVMAPGKHAEQIGEAIERGKFELRKRIG